MFNIWANYCKYFVYILHFIPGIPVCTVHSQSASHIQLRQIELSRDETFKPCEDFYGYACGEWPKQHPDTNYDEVTGLLDYRTNKRLLNIIETAYQHPYIVHDECQTFVQKTRCYYKACRMEDTLNITRYFDHVKPGAELEWPLIELMQAQRRTDNAYAMKQWNPKPEQWNLFALLGILQSYGFNNALINHEISRNQDGSLRIELELPYMSQEDEWPPQMLEVFLMRWGLPTQKAAVYAKKIRGTQEHWHAIYANFSETADEANRVELSYRDLQQTYPQLLTYLKKILPDNQRSDSDIVIIENLDYFNFLLSYQWSAPAQITNYLMLKFLTHLLKDATQGFTKMDCVRELRNKMDLAVNYLYYEKIYCPTAKEYDMEIAELERKLKKYFWLTLQENHLQLNSSLVQQLQSKIEALKINVGNLPPDRSYSEIQEFYSDVPPLDKSNYYSNHLHLLRHRFLKSLLNAQQQSFFVATDNRVGSSSAPIYIVRQNMVILPFGFLQPPVFDYTFEPLLVWSLLGFLLAHEFTHAIDTTGLYHDHTGQMLPGEPEVLQNDKFAEAVECMQEQQATEEIDERLSDLVGARVAYKAYVNELQNQLQPKSSPIHWKKLFYLNMAQFFCGRDGIQFVAHDADKVRLHEIVKNSQGFAEAFQCPPGSPMNPQKKCHLY